MKVKIIPAALILSLLTFFACKKDETSSTEATISALTCASAGFTTTPTSGTAYTGSAVVPYTGGNGAAYSVGTAIASTGVTGLTATLQGATLASGAGNLTYTITGTPASSGTASFAVSFGGQSCALSLTVNAAGTTSCSSLSGQAKVACLADAFKATLSTSQIASLQTALSKSNAIKWSNLPGGVSIRNGLEFSTLSATQLAAALAVIQAASGTTANEGFDEFNKIRAADDYLQANGGGSNYASTEYIIAFLGTSSATGTWMLQFGGHHYAQNVTFSGGTTVSGTPSHQGVEPRTWTSGGTTYAPLSTEASAMATMLASFTATELATAKLTTTFSDVLLGPNKDGQFPTTKLGIKVSTLSTAAQANVFAAIMPWLNDLDDNIKATLVTLYTNELANTYVSYSGNASGTSGNASSFFTANADYVRIDGPSVWVEFVCQSGAVLSGIHYHTVFRDHAKDYNGL